MLRVLNIFVFIFILSSEITLAASIDKPTEVPQGLECSKSLESAKKSIPIKNRFNNSILYYSGPHKEQIFSIEQVLSFLLDRPFVEDYEETIAKIGYFLVGLHYKEAKEFELEAMMPEEEGDWDPFFDENAYVLDEDGGEKAWGDVARDFLLEQYPELTKLKINDAIFNNLTMRLRWLARREAEFGSELVLYQFHDDNPFERRHH